MAGIDGDILWPHFKPLWSDLRGLGTGNIQIAGGYGLYLKQQWLRENPERQIVIPLAQWIDATPVAARADLAFQVSPQHRILLSNRR